MRLPRSLFLGIFLLCAAARGDTTPPLFYWSSANLHNVQAYIDPATYGFYFGIGGLTPGDLALDSAGNFYVAAIGNKTILKHPVGGGYSLFGSTILPADPYDILFDSSGNLFASTGLGGQIWKYDSLGNQSVFATGLQPYGMAFDSVGNLFETDLNGTIYKITPGGVITPFAAGFGANNLAIDSSDNVYTVDSATARIIRYTPAGVQSVFASGLSNPLGLAFDSAGNLLVTDYGSGSGGLIYSYDAAGTQTTLVTGLTTPAFILAAPAPEPASMTLLLAAGTGLFTLRRRGR